MIHRLHHPLLVYLSDVIGRKRALEIAARRLAPSLVVLSTCIGAVPPRGDLAGSLAAAFVAAGADQVVATLRPVDDDGARELARRFYAAGGVDDPVRALADAQAALALTPNAEWPQFAVFGTDVCSRRP